MHYRSRSLLAAAVVSAIWQLPANAEETSASAASESRLGTVLVTGTRGTSRTVLDSPVPVDVLTAEDLKSAGAADGELGAALQTLLPSFSLPRQSNSGGADHVRAAQLRGMSADATALMTPRERRPSKCGAPVSTMRSAGIPAANRTLVARGPKTAKRS